MKTTGFLESSVFVIFREARNIVAVYGEVVAFKG